MTGQKGVVCIEGAHHRVHRGRYDIKGSVSVLSAGAYTATLDVMVNIVKGGGRVPKPSPGKVLAKLGKFVHRNGTYARKRALSLCVYSVGQTLPKIQY